MKNLLLAIIALLVIGAAAMLLLRSTPEISSPQSGPAPGFSIAAHKGKVLVLLLGMEGCPETRRITPLLDPFVKTQNPDVIVARVDVPPPGQTLKPRADWPHAYGYETDPERKLATELEFFYYPTLYVIDRDGQVRYAGGFEEEKLVSMTEAISKEPTGLANKKMYTPPLPAVGKQAPSFAGNDLQGKPRSLSDSLGKKATLVFFGSSSCPFSVKALADVKDIASSLGKDGLSVLVVNRQEKADQVRKVYNDNDPGVPVILDADGSICAAYGVEPVPFQFVLDGKGAIAQRGPFTAANAVKALTSLMGGSSGACSSGPSGAG